MERRAVLKTLAMLGGGAALASNLEGFAAPAAPAPSPLARFKLGSISDEWSQDFEAALQAMKSYGLEWVEIRTLWNIYNTEATPQQTERMKDLLAKYAFKVSVLDTALYKCVLPGTRPVATVKDPYPYEQQMEMFRRAIDRAHALGTDKLRVFTFWRVAKPEKSFPRIAEEMGKAVELARSNGLRVVLENESACNVATGGELAHMLSLVPSPNFGANWDVGNGLDWGEASFPNGYVLLPKERIWHMHLKDIHCTATPTTKKNSEAWKLKGGEKLGRSKCDTAIVGTGQVNLLGQLRALIKDGYQGTMSLEPEYEAPGVTHLEATKRSLEALLKIMTQALG